MNKMLKPLAIAAISIATLAPAIAADLGPEDIQRAIETYKQNEIRFKRDFVGKTIGFTWTFYNAKGNFFDDSEVRVEFGGGRFSGNVVCEDVDQKTKDLVIEWNKGQKASVSGTVNDVWFGNLHLKKCSITSAM